jgi:hypothetical protein
MEQNRSRGSKIVDLPDSADLSVSVSVSRGVACICSACALYSEVKSNASDPSTSSCWNWKRSIS